MSAQWLLVQPKPRPVRMHRIVAVVLASSVFVAWVRPVGFVSWLIVVSALCALLCGGLWLRTAGDIRLSETRLYTKPAWVPQAGIDLSEIVEVGVLDEQALAYLGDQRPWGLLEMAGCLTGAIVIQRRGWASRLPLIVLSTDPEELCAAIEQAAAAARERAQR